MSDWQTIKSAPKDGTEVMLSDGKWVLAGYWYSEGEDRGNWFEINNDPTDHYGGPIYPALWRPYPNPPKLTPEKQMTLNDYQIAAIRTAEYPPAQTIIYPAMALAGEAGEVANKASKLLRGDYGHNWSRQIAKEIGDVLWNCAALARDLGYTLQEVAQMNLDKLSKREADGSIKGQGDDR
jgi:NTP pyrophosphatase (non-canonical NTP hydrolase)